MVVRGLLILYACLRCAAGADLAQVRNLYEADRIFDLRRTLEESTASKDETAFYRAVLAARFGHERSGIDQLRQFLQAHPHSPLEKKANEELAGAFERIGEYREAAQAWSQALQQMTKRDPARDGDANSEQLNEALRDVPAQTVHSVGPGTVQARRNDLGSWNVPVEVNGKEGEWIFDTGANMSTITESEARRMNLSIRDTTTYVNGSTGKKNALRLATADDLHVGNLRFSHVVLLVLEDRALYIAPIQQQITAILGLPVIRAMAHIDMSGDGLMKLADTAQAQAGEPNLFFQELTPMLASPHRGRTLQMFLDTGNNTTFLYPSVRPALSTEELSRLTKKTERMGGAGGVIKRTVEVIPSLDFEVLGKTIQLRALSLGSSQPKGDAGHRDGVFGADVLSGGFELDFASMQFRIR
jgi:predicted aspartyl protease